MTKQFSDDTLEEMKKFKNLFDPDCRLNPGKLLPSGKCCGEIFHQPLEAANTY